MNRVQKQEKRGDASSSVRVGEEYPGTSALEVKRLQEKVNHLAIEVFHLTTELEEVRHLLSTLVAEAALPARRPSRTPAASTPGRAFSELPADIGLDCFPSERGAPAPPKPKPNDVPNRPIVARPRQTDSLIGSRSKTSPPSETLASSERRSRAVHASKVTGLAALLVIGLGKAGDPIASMTDSALSATPLAVSRAFNPAMPEQQAGRQPGLRQVAQMGHVSQTGEVPSRYPTPATPESGPAVNGANDSRSARLSVARYGLGSGVVGRELVGQSNTFRVGATVVFWTHVSGGRRGETIHHRWFHDGTQRVDVVLPVDSPSWRTHSRYTLPAGAEGDWTVELRDSQDRLLAIESFRSEG